MQISQTSTFGKQVKKLYNNEKLSLDKAIKTIVDNPSVGEEKKGDLAGVFVYKFRMAEQLVLLAYTCDINKSHLVLLAFGSHENFYRSLKD